MVLQVLQCGEALLTLQVVAEVLESGTVELHVVLIMLEKLYLPVGGKQSEPNDNLPLAPKLPRHSVLDNGADACVKRITLNSRRGRL